MADVLISEFMDKPTAQGLIADFDVHWDPDLWGKRDELLARVAEARAIIVRNATQVNVELLDAAKKLEIVARMGVGLDNIDVAACKARDRGLPLNRCERRLSRRIRHHNRDDPAPWSGLLRHA